MTADLLDWRRAAVRDPQPALDEAFWARVAVNGDCWEWTGSQNGAGYGMVYRPHIRRSGILTHRYSWNQLVGEIPDGLVLDHLCRNRICLNPDHLEPVTQQVNVLRSGNFAARNAAKTHCPGGHEYTPANTRTDQKNRRFCRRCNTLGAQRRRHDRRIAEGVASAASAAGAGG